MYFSVSKDFFRDLNSLNLGCEKIEENFIQIISNVNILKVIFPQKIKLFAIFKSACASSTLNHDINLNEEKEKSWEGKSKKRR
jgi:hypothetical protein